MNPLFQRVGVSLILIPLFLILAYREETLPFKLLVLVFLVLAFLELGRMARDRGISLLYFSGMYFLLLFWMPTSGIPFAERMSLPALLVLGLMLMFLEFSIFRRNLSEMMSAVSFTFFGACYFGILGSYFLLLRRLPDGFWHLLVLFVATWAYDTGGYFVGKRWGRHRLAPVISPKKSWEGCIGGFSLSAVALAVLGTLAPPVRDAYTLSDLMILAFLLSVMGQAGDLVESMIKRSLSAKDSGNLLPGHGGIFDRIDSALFNAPVLFYYFILLKR